MQDIEAIFFDMGGTIRMRPQNHGHREAMMSRLVRLLGSDNSPTGFDANEFGSVLSRRAKEYKRWALETRQELAEEELWTQWMLPDWPPDVIEPAAVQLNQLWRSSQGTRVIRPDARDVILELDRRGYLLGLVSNTTSRVDSPRLLKAMGVSDCFKTVVLSAVFGKRKPDPAIFLQAIQNLGVRADRCAHVGDRPSRDLVGARSAGVATVAIIRDPNGAPSEWPFPKANGAPSEWPSPKANGAPLEPLDAALTPDHVIQSLSELLSIFPPLAGQGEV